MGSTGDSMQTTEKNLKEKKAQPEPASVVKSPVLASVVRSPSLESQETSKSLSKDLAGELMTLIKKVNEHGVTPETVNASCNAAHAIHKILNLNYLMKKDGF
jgi:hypothetical protein